ncbi:hypothetical protein [Microbacterium sp. NPDC077184]|uniref:hypothetical protein n=1 Tax=Microbacterium sp. NPDC077184 TaxID=3154764 RepID=UPI0034256E0F
MATTSNEGALGAEATAAEGSNQNPAEEPAMTIIAESPAVDPNIAPCPRFTWCTGHARVTNLDDIAAHFGTVARIVGPRGELVLRFWLQEPTLSFPEVEPPSFTIDGWDDWEIGFSEVDVEIDEYLALLAEARAAMREFAGAHPELGATA